MSTSVAMPAKPPEQKSAGAVSRMEPKATPISATLAQTKDKKTANATTSKTGIKLRIVFICKPSRLLLSTTKPILHRLDHVVKKSFT